MHPLFLDIFSTLTDTLFPIVCLGCGAEGVYACQACLSPLLLLPNQVCLICQERSPGGETHRGCKKLGQADGLTALLDYSQPPISQLIIAGKYKFIPEIFHELGRFAAKTVLAQLLFPHPDIISFIPLHPSRQRWRGFNQSEIIAAHLESALKVPSQSLLQRPRRGQVQKNLSRHERLTNLTAAFIPAAQSKIFGKNILLIDDVVTTGATLRQAAQTLKAAGCNKVWCLTLARET